MLLEQERFRTIVESTPLLSIDLLIRMRKAGSSSAGVATGPPRDSGSFPAAAC